MAFSEPFYLISTQVVTECLTFRVLDQWDKLTPSEVNELFDLTRLLGLTSSTHPRREKFLKMCLEFPEKICLRPPTPELFWHLSPPLRPPSPKNKPIPKAKENYSNLIGK